MFKHKFVKQAPVAAFFAANAGAIAAGSALVGAVSAINSASAQKKSISAQRKMADVSAARERVQAARQARIARASILAGAGNEGVGGSGVAGATASIGSQLGSNAAFSNTMQTFGNQVSSANQKAANWQAVGGAFQAIGGIASSMTDWDSIFGGQQSRQNTASNIARSSGKILTVGGG
jgi:hypothetical protein